MTEPLTPIELQHLPPNELVYIVAGSTFARTSDGCDLKDFPRIGTIMMERRISANVYFVPMNVNWDGVYSGFYVDSRAVRRFRPSRFVPASRSYSKLLRMPLSVGGSDYRGCDPELFLVDEKGVVAPAFQHFSDKDSVGLEHPYWDGFQAEFRTEPMGCHDRAIGRCRTALKTIEAYATPKKLRISPRSVIEIPFEMLAGSQKQHVELGCEPSLNAYGHRGQLVSDGRQLPIRFAGGHIHFGVNDSIFTSRPTKTQLASAVKALDAILGVMCVSLFQGMDDPIRRRFYGLAGEYRLPPHGLEYRVLSNAWLMHPSFTHLVFDIARWSVQLALGGYFTSVWRAISERWVVAAINNCDVKVAQNILRMNKQLLCRYFEDRYGDTGGAFTWAAIHDGMRNRIDIDTVAENWQLHNVEPFYRWEHYVSLNHKPNINMPNLPNVSGDRQVAGSVSPQPAV